MQIYFYMSSLGPNLIDTDAKIFLDATLQKCHQTRIKTHTFAFNLIMFVLFFAIAGGFLYYCYRSKPTREDAQYKIMKDQEYILSKIRYYQEKGANPDLPSYSTQITNLPV